MVWHRSVIAASCVFFASACFIGCRTQPSWSPFAGPGCRVPPPSTGSYGSPNTYYQPGVQSVPATVPPAGARTLTTPSNQWTTVRDPAPKVASLSTSSSTSLSASSAPRLNGMPVNTIRAPAEPQAFTPPDMMTELNSTINGRSSANAVMPASAIQPVGDSSSPVGSAGWQSRSVSNPRPVIR